MWFMSHVGCETCYLNFIVLFRRLHCCIVIMLVHLVGNPVQLQRTKHIEMDIHFLREKGGSWPGSSVTCPVT